MTKDEQEAYYAMAAVAAVAIKRLGGSLKFTKAEADAGVGRKLMIHDVGHCAEHGGDHIFHAYFRDDG